MPDAIEVRKVPIHSVADASELAKLIDDGVLHADRVVAITTDWRNTGVKGSVSAPDFHDWHDTASSFEAMAYYTGGETSVSVNGASDYATALRVTPGFFDVFGVRPERGRVFEAGDETPGSPLTAVIGHGFWMRRFGGDARAIGGTLSLSERTFTIVGIMPAGFTFPVFQDVWVPLRLRATDYGPRQGPPINIVGRLAPGATIARAQSEVAAWGQRAATASPTATASRTSCRSSSCGRSTTTARGNTRRRSCRASSRRPSRASR